MTRSGMITSRSPRLPADGAVVIAGATGEIGRAGRRFPRPFRPARAFTAKCCRDHYVEHALVDGPRRADDSYMSPLAMPTPGIPESTEQPRNNNGVHSAGVLPAQPVNEKRFRAILGRFTTGVVAVTALRKEDSTPVGLAANSFTSVSLDPPLVLICVAHTSTSWPHMRSSDRFCINILGEDQREISTRFATSGSDKFKGVSWTKTPNGTPMIDGAIGWLECSIDAEHPAGDHTVIIARVHHVDAHHDGAPLVFYRGSYGQLAAPKSHIEKKQVNRL